MSEFVWKNHKWIVGQVWGLTHPDKNNSWFAEDAVIIRPDCMELRVINEPGVFGGVTKPYGVGLVTCTDKLSYGTYVWKCTMPTGTNLWPALWMSAVDNWPPEIDMVEGYTYSKDSDYTRNICETYLESNVHYNDANGKHQNCKAKGVPTIIYKLLHKSIDTYKLVWSKKSIRFYYNGVLVRTIKDSDALKDLNKYPDMHVIMNLEINTSFSDVDLKCNPVFKIYDFQYTPMN